MIMELTCIKSSVSTSSKLTTIFKILTDGFFGFVCVCLLTQIVKFSVGRQRPNFYAMCSPNWDKIDCGTRDNPTLITNYECTGRDPDLISALTQEFGKNEEKLISTFKRHAHTSFFSGHSSLIWASAFFT